MMTLKEQVYVCTVAETGSTTAAARQLNLSQPALTQYIQNLENRMGIKLFDRVGKRFMLTYAGQVYVEKARQMLEIKAEFDETLHDIMLNYSTRLRFGVQNVFSPYLMPELLAWMTEAQPNVKPVFWERREAEMKQMLVKNQIAFFFGNLLFPDSLNQYHFHPLLEEHTLLALPKGHPIAAQCEKRPSDRGPWPEIDLAPFMEETFVLQPPTYKLRVDADAIFHHLELSPKNIIKVPQAPTLLRIIASGQGIGFALPSNVWLFGLQDQLELYEVAAPPQMNQFGAVTIRERHLPDYAQEVIQQMGIILDAKQRELMEFYRK